LDIFWVYFDPDGLPTQLMGYNKSGACACEGIEYRVIGKTGCQEDAQQKGYGRLLGMHSAAVAVSDGFIPSEIP